MQIDFHFLRDIRFESNRRSPLIEVESNLINACMKNRFWPSINWVCEFVKAWVPRQFVVLTALLVATAIMVGYLSTKNNRTAIRDQNVEIEQITNSVVEHTSVIEDMVSPIGEEDAQNSNVSNSSARHKKLSQINPAFSAATEVEVTRLAPAIRAKYFENGDPQYYLRHEVLKIDTEAFQSQIKAALSVEQNSGNRSEISVPLLSDVTVVIGVNSWIENPLGIMSLDGTVESSQSPSSYSTFQFRSDGRMSGIVNIDGGGFVIDPIGEPPYYLVMELQQPSSGDSID